jgi:hypothetical protein
MHETTIAVGISIHSDASNLTHVVDCHGLTLDNLPPDRFRGELRSREAWIKNQCQGGYQIGPLRDIEGRVVGRRFRFEDMTEASAFKLVFAIRL